MQPQALQPVDTGPPLVPGEVSDHDMAVLEALVQGKTLEEAGVNTAFLLRIAKSADLSLVYSKAREMSAFALEEEALGRLRAAVVSGNVPATALRALDMLVQQLRWSAIKRNPNVYSEKAAVNVTVPIQIHTTLDLGEGLSTGTKEYPNIYEARAEVVQEHPIADLDQGRPMADILYGGTKIAEPPEGTGTAGQQTAEEEAKSDTRAAAAVVDESTVVASPRRPRPPTQAQSRRGSKTSKARIPARPRGATRQVADVGAVGK